MFDLSPICRTCMDMDSKYYQIDDYVEENTAILDMLNGIAPQIKIKEEGMDLSNLICETCVDKLISSYSFQQLCINSDCKFRQQILNPVEEVVLKTEDNDLHHLIEDESVEMKIEIFNLDESSKADNDIESDYNDMDGKDDALNNKEYENCDYDENEDADNDMRTEKDALDSNEVDMVEKDNTRSTNDDTNDFGETGETIDWIDGEYSYDGDLANDQDYSVSEGEGKENKDEEQQENEEDEYEENKIENRTPLRIIKVKTRKRFSCGDCGRVYDRVSRVQDHLKKKHKYTLKSIKQWLETAEKVEEELAAKETIKLKQKRFKEEEEKKRVELKQQEEDSEEGTLIKVKLGDKIGFLDTSKYKIQKPKPIRLQPYTCDVCGKICYGILNFQRHSQIHSIHKKYFCDICNSGFTNQNGLRGHRKLHERKDKNVDEKKPLPPSPDEPLEIFKCPNCPKIFLKKKSLLVHVRKYKEKSITEKFPCRACEKEFASKKNLSEHIRFRHPEITYSCDQCDRKFVEQEHLQHHLNAHRDLVCHVCERLFTTEQSLEEHKNTHTGENPFLCPECGKAFKYSSSLRQHIARHPNYSRYKCSECSRGFTNQKELQQHIDKTHRGIKPPKQHICDVCGQQFAYSNKLKRHKLTKH